MDENKAVSIFCLTDEIHNDVDDLYEAMTDDENAEAIKKIEELIHKLKELKNNLTIKNEV